MATKTATTPPVENPMAKFDYAHLAEELHVIGRPFYALAHHLKDVLPEAKLRDALENLSIALEGALAGMGSE